MRQSADSTNPVNVLQNINKMNIESQDIIIGQENESVAAATAIAKDEDKMAVEEINDQATASNTTANLNQGAKTALSVGMSPANLSVIRDRQRSETLMPGACDCISIQGDALNNYASVADAQ